MGCYIETEVPILKAMQIGKIPAAKAEVVGPNGLKEALYSETRVGVCVFVNGPFDAALVVCNDREYDAATEQVHDKRRRVFLTVDRAWARQQTGGKF